MGLAGVRRLNSAHFAGIRRKGNAQLLLSHTCYIDCLQLAIFQIRVRDSPFIIVKYQSASTIHFVYLDAFKFFYKATCKSFTYT